MNLLDNFEFSFADFHRLSSVPAEVSEDNIRPAGEAKEKRLPSIKTLGGLVGGLTLAVVFVVLVLKIFFAPAPVPLTPVNKMPITAGEPVVTAPQTTGYTRLEVIEFSGTPQTVSELVDAEITVVAGSAPEDRALAGNIPPVTTVTPSRVVPQREVVAPPVAEPPRVVPQRENRNTVAANPLLYSLKADLDETAYKKLMGSTGTRKSTVTEKTSSRTAWTVYKPALNTGIIMEGIEVSEAGVYKTKGEAVSFAQSLLDVDTVIVKQNELKDKIYSVTVCCMEYSEASELAREAGLFAGAFNLVRQEE